MPRNQPSNSTSSAGSGTSYDGPPPAVSNGPDPRLRGGTSMDKHKREHDVPESAPPKDPAMIDQRPDPAQGDAQRRRRYSRKQRFQEPSAGTRRSARTAGASSSRGRTHSQRDDADEEHTSDQPDGMVGKVMKMLKK
ncbi:unnamed protein product [Jaminaea pallidilutea]